MKRLAGLLSLCLCAATPAFAYLLSGGAVTPAQQIANVQGRSSSQSSTCSTTRSVSLARAVASGGAVTVTTGWFPSSAGTLSSVTDDKGNSYAFVQNQIANIGSAAAYLTNITNGPTTVTMTFTGCVAYGDNVIDEWSGLGSFDVSASNTQTAPGTGTDAVTSTAATTTGDGDLIFGLCNATNATVVNLGTGFSLTTGGVAAASNSKTEWKIQSAAGPVAATCTAVDGSQSTSAMVVAITRSGVPGARQLIASISPTTGSFTTGASSSFMTETATLTPTGSGFNGTWAITSSATVPATPTDHAGVTCNNYGSNIVIDSATGVISNDLNAPAQAYPGLCVTATEAGVSNSPYTQALSVTGAAQTIASISPSACSFFAGAQNGNICTLAVAMNPASPRFTGTFALCTGTDTPIVGCSGANSGGFQLVGAGDSKNLEQSSAAGGTAAGTYTDVTAYAQQSGTPSAFQRLTLTGGAGTGTITTMTVQNTDPVNPIVPGASGYPYIAGQAFARLNSNGVPSTGVGSHPICQDASNNASLVCQWDDISTRRENGDDGTWRHASLTVLLPPTSPQYTSVSGGSGLAACSPAPAVGHSCPGSFQIKFVNISGTYAATAAPGTINDVCNGHDIKLVFTDVRNQDDSFRGPTISGTPGGANHRLTFDTCANLANTGRDAPFQYAKGPARNGWIVRGVPVYDNGAKDPLLYVQCFMDQTYTISGAIGPLRHTCITHNGWVGVAADTAGISGSPGPVGFSSSTGGGTVGSGHGDPQIVNYRPVLFDGGTSALDWGATYFDATVPDSNFNTTTQNWTIPNSVANTTRAWGNGDAFRYSDSATPPGGLSQGEMIFNCMSNSCFFGGSAPRDYTQQVFSTIPRLFGFFIAYTGSAGTGTSTFSWRVFHMHAMSWVAVDPTGAENWAAVGSGTRYTSPLLPFIKPAERTYWAQTGLVFPWLDVSANPHFNTGSVADNLDGFNDRYAPIDINNMAANSGVGGRPSIGPFNEFYARAWSLQSATGWQAARAAALSASDQPNADVLNESTGHILVVNNGPPGANHAGSGATYPGMGSNYTNCDYFERGTGFCSMYAHPLQDVPIFGGRYDIGNQAGTTDVAHMPAYASGAYITFGSEHYLWLMHQTLEWDTMHDKDPTYTTLANGVTYYASFDGCCERRGSAWVLRDMTSGAALGCDFNCPSGSPISERQYFNDIVTENYYYGINAGIDHPPTPNSGSIIGGMGLGNSATFVDTYVTSAGYLAWTYLHSDLGKAVLSAMYRLEAATCGDTIVPNSPSIQFCSTYDYIPVQKTATTQNLVDAGDYGTDYASCGTGWQFTAGSPTVAMVAGPRNGAIAPFWLARNGGNIKFIRSFGTLPPEITEGQQYFVLNANSSNGTFQLSATSGGPAITFSSSTTMQCGVARWPRSLTGTGEYFLNGDYGPYVISQARELLDVNQSLGNILPSQAAVVNNLNSFVSANTQGWLGTDDALSDTFSYHHVDPTISPQ